MPWKANSMHGFVMVFLHDEVEKEGRPERGFSFHPTPLLLFIGYKSKLNDHFVQPQKFVSNELS